MLHRREHKLLSQEIFSKHDQMQSLIVVAVIITHILRSSVAPIYSFKGEEVTWEEGRRYNKCKQSGNTFVFSRCIHWAARTCLLLCGLTKMGMCNQLNTSVIWSFFVSTHMFDVNASKSWLKNMLQISDWTLMSRWLLTEQWTVS